MERHGLELNEWAKGGTGRTEALLPAKREQTNLSNASSPSSSQYHLAGHLLDGESSHGNQDGGRVDTKVKSLSSQEALSRLHDDMESEIKTMSTEFHRRTLITWLVKSISFRSELSKMRWPSVVFMTAHVLAHFIVSFILRVENLASNWVGLQGFILLIFLIFNLAVNLWDTKLRFKELLMKAEQICNLVGRCSQDKYLLKKWRQYSWTSADAKSLFAPKSPCVHRTLTYRDESCLNLPDYLLVRGDIIHLYPGERAPGDCISLENSTKSLLSSLEDGSNWKRLTLKEDEIFYTEAQDDIKSKPGTACLVGESHTHAKLTKARTGTDFLMLSTPYIKSLRISLQRSHKRPVNSIEKECFIVSRKYFETYVIPLVFTLSTFVTAIHYGYLDLADNDQEIKKISIVYLLLRPSLTIMPFLPWMFPCFWMAVNAYGSARLLCCAEMQRRQVKTHRSNEDDFPSTSWNLSLIRASGGIKSPGTASNMENLLATPTAAGSSDQNRNDDELRELQNNIGFFAIFRTFIDLILGKSGHVWRSSSLLQVLGCLTSLCCIDKVGILSWPNPTPEKVFVLTKNEQESHPTRSYLANLRRESNNDETNPVSNTVNQNLIGLTDERHFSEPNVDPLAHNSFQTSTGNLHVNSMKHSINQTRPEVLDVSQAFNLYRGFNESLALHQETRLQFDDPDWTKFINNLKPLGLTILMNNCCEKSFGDYYRFYKHICYESILRCNLTPVVKRRCICALASLIGFSSDAIKSYRYIKHIGAYRLIDPRATRKGKLVSSLENAARLKLPFPNMICNIQQDISTGSYQIFSQGTADILLDSCVEFWNGKQMMPLDEAIRKKIMDFYHRTSLTSYCSAFAYTPLLQSHDLKDNYIELPAEDVKFSSQLRRLTNEHFEECLHRQVINSPIESSTTTIKMQTHFPEDVTESNNIDICEPRNLVMSPKRAKKVPRRHLSAEDFCNDLIDRTSIQQSERRSHTKRRLDETLDELTDQVFLGMVATQYQACPDFVTLVEQLEHACIRFVHFSKENELRSRVFSEKMGLESGWNCHISLESNQEPREKDKSDVSFLIGETLTTNDNLGSQPKLFCPTPRIANILMGAGSEFLTGTKERTSSKRNSLASANVTLYSWRSLPSLVMQIISKVSSSAKLPLQHQPHQGKSGEQALIQPNNDQVTSSGDDTTYETYFKDSGQVAGDESGSSTKENGFNALAFDMSNRAKLPKGIENIRPHLEQIDNIPLQVSLFTDCTTRLTKEMIEIMQDYGEIVCVIGSAASRINTPLFLQANASIAIEPLMPQSCTQTKTGLERPTKARGSRVVHKSSLTKSHHGIASEVIVPQKSETFMGMPQWTSTQLSNPRDRLRMGPSIQTNGCEGQTRHDTNSLRLPTSSSRSSSSSSTSSTSSSRSSRSTISKLSQSLSDTNSSSSSVESFTCTESKWTNAESPSMRPDDRSDDEADMNIDDLANSLVHDIPEPSSLASKLASLPCSYNYNRAEKVNLYSLIMEARHFTFKMKNTFVCMICFALSISSAQFLASILFLPPILSSGLTIWLTVVVVPLMSFSLMSTTMDSQVMKIAVGKNLQLKPENITFFVICYLIKFIPSIIVVVLNFGLIIAHSCKSTGFGSSSLGPCWMFTYVRHGNSTSEDATGDGDLLWSNHLLTAQVCAAFLMVLYFVVISSGFVHRSHLVWQRSPTRNHLWCLISFALIAGQILYNQLVLRVNLNSSNIPYEFLTSLPLHIWFISFTWPILVVVINLFVKRAEIKATIRQQRRARFDFNTKLGMNSPF